MVKFKFKMITCFPFPLFLSKYFIPIKVTLIFQTQQLLHLFITALQYLFQLMDQRTELIKQNLYELPKCSICLEEMVQDLASLACGHVFHYCCINQHFQYKGTCPYCQKRAQQKQIRGVIFGATHNNKAGEYLQALLAKIQKSEGQQLHGLLAELKSFSQNNEKLVNDIKEYEKDIRRKNEQLQKMKREMESKTAELNSFRKQNQVLRRQYEETKIEQERLQLDLIELRTRYDFLLNQKKQMQQFRILQKVAMDNSQQLNKYKNEMEGKQTSPQLLAKSYFEMLQLKNLQVYKMKEKQKQYAEKYRYKEEENLKLKNQIQGLKNQAELNMSEINKWKSKYEKIKDKYREVSEKMKSKSVENIEPGQEIMEENSLSISIGFTSKMPLKSNLIVSSQRNQKAERQVTFNLVEKPKPAQIPKITFGNSLKKPYIEQKKPITLKNLFNS